MKAARAGQIVLAIAALLFAGAAWAQGFGGGPGAGMGEHRGPVEHRFGPLGAQGNWWNNPRMVERLKLTDDQRKAMDGIMLEHREKLIDLRANLEKAELGMQPLMGADTPNDAAIVAQIDKVVAARGELERANARFLLAIRDKLTLDQWKQIKDFRAEGMRGDQRDGWRHEGGRPGMGGPDGQGMQFRHRQGPPPQGAPQGPPPPAAPDPGTEH